MLSEICLVIIAVALLALIATLIKVYVQVQESARLIRTDLQNLSAEALLLLNNVNNFIRADLHAATNEANQLMNNINDKIHSLDFIFKPLNSMNSKANEESESEESEPQKAPISKTLKWVVSSASLIKTIKELISNHGK